MAVKNLVSSPHHERNKLVEMTTQSQVKQRCRILLRRKEEEG
jgi:hypothetical protein